MASQPEQAKRQCTLLVFLATPKEEEALAEAANSRNIAFQRIKDNLLNEEYHWLGRVGNETVIAVGPAREHGQIVMGALGRLGSAARGIRFREATGAQGIIQLGMAFGIDPNLQNPCDVLISSSLVPYDNRDVVAKPDNQGEYVAEYSRAGHKPARPSLVDLFLREKDRGGHGFGIHVGAILSGAARIYSSAFRDELKDRVPRGEADVVGGEMEGVGLLAASVSNDDPVWCVVKGISDFADKKRDDMIDRNIPIACRNAADFVLSALLNDAKQRYN